MLTDKQEKLLFVKIIYQYLLSIKVAYDKREGYETTYIKYVRAYLEGGEYYPHQPGQMTGKQMNTIIKAIDDGSLREKYIKQKLLDYPELKDYLIKIYNLK